MMRLLAWIIIPLIAIVTSAHAGTSSIAQAFVAKLCARYERSSPKYLGRDAPLAFAPDLVALIKQDRARSGLGYTGALDWDPLCGCQDPEGLRVAEISIEEPSHSTTRAIVRLRINDGKPNVIRLDLVRTQGTWRVSDVHEGELPSLVGLLRQQGR